MKIMKRWSFLRQPIVWILGVAVLSTAGLATSEEDEADTTQASMRSFFVALTTAYTFSLDPAAFAAPENRRQIEGVLDALVVNAKALDTHGGALDPSLDHLRRSLLRDANDAFTRFEEGNFVGSRFVLSKVAENCVACHTKLPAERQFKLGAEFLEAADIQDLPATSRVTLEVATRQFDTAMDTYEKILRSPEVTFDDLALYNVFENYLKVSIGALDDAGRPAKALLAFVERPDIPKGLKKDVESWIEALDGLQLDGFDGKQLAAARGMVDEAMDKTSSRSDRSELVDFIGSIAILHRYLRTEPADNADVAEAYYLLGAAESYVARSYWISETDFLMEKAIRLAPNSEVAKRAFKFLEEHTQSEYRVTPARTVPEDLRANLDELRELAGE
jgi:tetratricopeptide (TPR) repeat protein